MVTPAAGSGEKDSLDRGVQLDEIRSPGNVVDGEGLVRVQGDRPGGVAIPAVVRDVDACQTHPWNGASRRVVFEPSSNQCVTSKAPVTVRLPPPDEHEAAMSSAAMNARRAGFKTGWLIDVRRSDPHTPR